MAVPAKPRVRDVEATRAAILQAARARFAVYGYEWSTIRAIARDAGCISDIGVTDRGLWTCRNSAPTLLCMATGMRLLRLAGVLTVGVLFLSGCLRLDAGLTVTADDTVDGQLVVTAAKSVLTTGNRTLAQGFADLRKNIPALPQGQESIFEDADRYGIRITYHHTPLREFASGSVQLVRNGSTYSFSLPLDPQEYGGPPAADPLDEQNFLKSMEFEIQVTFPGPVLDSNGSAVGNTVSWQLKSGQDKPTHLYATAAAPTSAAPIPASAPVPPGGAPWVLIVGAVAVVLAAMVVVWLTLRPDSRAGAVASSDPQDHCAQDLLHDRTRELN
jgi:hypothetical protein